MSLDERLGGLLADAATTADVTPPTRAGVQSAIDRRRRRRRSVGTAIAASCLVAGIGGALALANVDGAEDSGVADTVDDLPLVGIDLVGFNRAPDLDPRPDPSGVDLTYAVFVADEPDVLGPMISASLQPGEPDDLGSPVDLGGVPGRMITFPDGAGVTWPVDGQLASVNGHGVSPEDVVAYARQLSDLPFDLDEMPAPDGLPNREVVQFEPQPDFPFRVTTYQGPGIVASVLTTSDPGYFDLTRIVSTEGTPYERIGFESTFLGPGEAILSPDDDGATSALVRTEAGLTVHVFGQHLDADTLRDAIEQDHLVALPDEDPTPSTTMPTTATTAPTTTTVAPDPASVFPRTQSVDVRFGVDNTTITVALADVPPEVVDLRASIEAPPECADAVAGYHALHEQFGMIPDGFGWMVLTIERTWPDLQPGPVADAQGDRFVVCEPAGTNTTVLGFELWTEPEETYDIDPVEGQPAVVIPLRP